MFEMIVPQTQVRRKAAPKATSQATEPTLTFTKSQWAAFNNGMLAELLLQQDGEDPRVLRSQWSAATQDDFDQGRARMRALLTDAGWTL